MIGFIRGKLVIKQPPRLLVDVNGVGYEVEAPMTTFYDLPEPGEDLLLYTHLVIRDDAHSLFGFRNEADRLMFRALIKVNGVGPKLALTILSGQTAEDFYHCIQHNDIPALVRLPGVGKKTAERLIIEMRDRLPKTDLSATETLPTDTVDQSINEAINALCALGYKSSEASKMINRVSSQQATSCEEMIKLALQGAARQ